VRLENFYSKWPHSGSKGTHGEREREREREREKKKKEFARANGERSSDFNPMSTGGLC
jgi:hypothetical protein